MIQTFTGAVYEEQHVMEDEKYLGLLVRREHLNYRSEPPEWGAGAEHHRVSLSPDGDSEEHQRFIPQAHGGFQLCCSSQAGPM